MHLCAANSIYQFHVEKFAHKRFLLALGCLSEFTSSNPFNMKEQISSKIRKFSAMGPLRPLTITWIIGKCMQIIATEKSQNVGGLQPLRVPQQATFLLPVVLFRAWAWHVSSYSAQPLFLLLTGFFFVHVTAYLLDTNMCMWSRTHQEKYSARGFDWSSPSRKRFLITLAMHFLSLK